MMRKQYKAKRKLKSQFKTLIDVTRGSVGYGVYVEGD